MEISTFLNSDAFGHGGLRRLPNVPFLDEDDSRFKDFRSAGFDIEEILAWVNHRNTVCRRNRIQLLDSFPILVPELAMNDELALREIEVSIDRGDELIKTLARIVGVGKAAVRFLRGKSPSLVGKGWTENVREVLWAIEFLPTELRPHSARDWETFREYWLCADLEGHWYYRDRESFCPRRMCLKEYMFIGLCHYGYEETSRNRLQRIAEGGLMQIRLASDYFSFVDCWLDYVSIEDYPQKPSLAAVFLMRYKLKELLRQSARWHREIMQQPVQQLWEGSQSDQKSFDSWPALLPEPFMADELQAVSLNSVEDLEQEGLRLDHCVGRYAEIGQCGTSHIISIRNKHGISFSTVQIEVIPNRHGKWQPRVVQHYAFGNGEPDQCFNTMVNRLLLHLMESSIQEHISNIHRFHEERHDALETHLVASREESRMANTEIMKAVLPDFDEAIAWLNQKHKPD